MGIFTRTFLRSWVTALLLTTIYVQSNAAEYTVNSADEFNSLSLSPGDVVTWSNGTYSEDENLSFTSNGTSSNPIVLQAETAGGVVFTGEMTMDISGDYVIVDGFYWNGGAAVNNHVEFRKGSDYADHSMIRNCAFNDLTPSGTDKHRWIVLYGTNNIVENCSFLNKRSPGALVLVELEYNDFNPVGHIIRNNYFYNYEYRDPSTTHSGDSETIRVGTSEFQDKSASVLVENNYFQAADGENEIITNKSANNTYKHNTFRNCHGSLVLRHGANARVEGNYFLGENKEGSGGIRVSDSFHTIINNYMEGLNNDGDPWNNSITLVGGSDATGGTSNGYQRVDDILVAFNTVYNADDPLYYNDRSSYDPTGVFAYNLVYSTNGTLVSGDISGTGQGMEYVGNLFGGSSIGISDSGISEADGDFSADGGVFKPSSSGPAANAAGGTYADVINFDIEGRERPDSNIDVGAHEVSGGSGSAIYGPYTDGDVGVSVGACFVSATGSSLNCSGGGESLSLSSLSSFSSNGGNATLTVSSNVSWSATDNASWITLSPISGSDDGSITVTVSSNYSTSSRSGMVTVTGGSLTRTVTVTQEGAIQDIAVTGVNLTPALSSIIVGSDMQLSVSVIPSNATNQEVSYSSNNATIAIVDSYGVVTGLSEGIVTITVTIDDGAFIDTSVVTVTKPSEETNLALNKGVTGTGTPDGEYLPTNLVDGDLEGDSRWSVSGFPQSATIDLGAVFSLESTEVVCYNDRAYQYVIEVATSSSGSYTEVVDRSGNTTEGSTTSPIVDSFSPVEARYVKVTVLDADAYTGNWVSLTEVRVFGEAADAPIPVTSVSLTPSNASMKVGDTQQFSSVISPSNATDQVVSYSSSNSTVVIVDAATGLVTAQSAGSATITVTTQDGGLTDISTVIVTNGESMLPSPWETADVGGVGVTGSVDYVDGTFTVSGAGADIWNAADEFRFVYQTLEGDGEIIAKVNSLTNTNVWAKAGVMVRETLDAGSKHAISVVTPARGVSFQRRTTTNGSSSHTTISGETAPEWLRITRSSDLISAYYSNDGSNWTQAGSSITLSMNNVVYVGLCVTSHVDATLTTASFSDVSVSVTDTPELTNLALNQSVTASEEQSNNPALNLVDGDPDTRWSAEYYPQSAVIDLGANARISSTEVICFDDRAYQYTIEVASTPGGTYSQIVDRTGNSIPGSNDSPIEDSFSPVLGRYVRITVAGASDYSGSWCSIEELKINGYYNSARTLSNDQPEFIASEIQEMILYPVPVLRILNVELPNFSEYLEIEVLDMNGRILPVEPVVQSEGVALNVSALPKGMYLLRVLKSNGDYEVKRFKK